jgi:hypothetical protein
VQVGCRALHQSCTRACTQGTAHRRTLPPACSGSNPPAQARDRLQERRARRASEREAGVPATARYADEAGAALAAARVRIGLPPPWVADGGRCQTRPVLLLPVYRPLTAALAHGIKR